SPSRRAGHRPVVDRALPGCHGCADPSVLLACCRRRMTASAPFLSTVTHKSWPSSSTAQKRLWGYLVTHSMACLRVLEWHQLRLLAPEPLAVLRDQPPQHRRVVAWKVLDMRGMAPGPAGEEPVLGQVLDELRARGNLPLRQRAQNIGADKALGRLQDGEASGAIVLRVVPLVVGWAIPAMFEGVVGAALGHAPGHELVRRRARRK